MNISVPPQSVGKQLTLFKDAHTYVSDRGFTWPNYNYLGPGNSLDRGAPVSPVDAAARDHDIAYDRALTFDDVKAADEKAISSFSSRLFSEEHTAALMGVYGLASKTITERLYGQPIYPSLSNLRNRSLHAPGNISYSTPGISISDNKHSADSLYSPRVTSGVTASQSFASSQSRKKFRSIMLCPRRRRQW